MNMRRMTLFNVLVVLVLLVVGIGFYQGWFILSGNKGGDESNKVEIQLTVDPDKVKEDAKTVEAKARDLTGTEAEQTPSGLFDDDVKRND